MRKRFYNPYFTPMQYNPALWLDASDPSTLIMDGARTFDGLSQRLTLASNSTITGGNIDLAVAGWIYFTTIGTTSVLVIKSGNHPASSVDYVLQKTSGNQLSFGISYNSGSYSGIVTHSTVVTTNTWYFAFAYHDATAQKTYISLNGGAFTEAANTKTPIADQGGSISFGAYPNGAILHNGRQDSFCIFKPTSGWLASNATVLRDYLYNGGSGRRSSDFMASSYYINGNPSGAVSWWDMDARSGDEPDRIGSNNLTDNGRVGYASGIASGMVQYTGDPVKQWNDKSGNVWLVTAASDAASGNATHELQIFAAGNSVGMNSPMVLCEVLIFPTALPVFQRQQVERYLGGKWGISVP